MTLESQNLYRVATRGGLWKLDNNLRNIQFLIIFLVKSMQHLLSISISTERQHEKDQKIGQGDNCVFLFVYLFFLCLYLCICVFVHLYLCICICVCKYVDTGRQVGITKRWVGVTFRHFLVQIVSCKCPGGAHVHCAE